MLAWRRKADEALVFLRPSSLAVRADMLERMLLRAEDVVSDTEVRMLLPESKMLGASSDLTEE
jgi:hypothetical protein